MQAASGTMVGYTHRHFQYSDHLLDSYTPYREHHFEQHVMRVSNRTHVAWRVFLAVILLLQHNVLVGRCYCEAAAQHADAASHPSISTEGLQDKCALQVNRPCIIASMTCPMLPICVGNDAFHAALRATHLVPICKLLHDPQLKLWEPCGDINKDRSSSGQAALACCPPGSSCSYVVEPSLWICQPVAAAKHRALLVSNSTSNGQSTPQATNTSATAVNGDVHGGHSTTTARGNGRIILDSGNTTAEAAATEASNSTDVESVICNQEGACMAHHIQSAGTVDLSMNAALIAMRQHLLPACFKEEYV